MTHRRILIWLAMLGGAAAGLQAQVPTATARGRVELSGASPGKPRHAKMPDTVVWLTPLTATGSEAPSSDLARNLSSTTPRLTQKNKTFEPHILVVPAGASVEFPNRDPFFHNVFSLFEGKRFDLGLYEAGTSKMVQFDRPGISYIFCNIHPEMSAVVITLETRLFAISTPSGQLAIADVPYGRYRMHIWSEGMGPENAQPLTREVTIGENASSLGVVRVPEANGQRMAHKNKYGRDYDEPVPNNSVYNQHR